jgi:formylmethanofuran dehydrogenase subunit E
MQPRIAIDSSIRRSHRQYRRNIMINDDRDVLLKALDFHGQRCWASAVGVRIGLAALEALSVERSGGSQLVAAVEIGEKHGAMCFAGRDRCRIDGCGRLARGAAIMTG